MIAEIVASLDPNREVWIPKNDELIALGFQKCAPGRWYMSFQNRQTLYFHEKDNYSVDVPQWCLGDWGHETKITCVLDIVLIAKLFGINK